MKKLKPETYDEFVRDYSVDVPENYNYAYDFIDETAKEDPGRPAMIHVDNQGNCRNFDLEYFSTTSAKGDPASNCFFAATASSISLVKT